MQGLLYGKRRSGKLVDVWRSFENLGKDGEMGNDGENNEKNGRIGKNWKKLG